MASKRSKKRNLLTQDIELIELAYSYHVCINRLRQTLTHINIPAAYRLQILRHVQWLYDQAISLGLELSTPDANAFTTKESAERAAELCGLFD